ncbi:Kinesin-like protein KIP1 [Phytophthora ramorum]|uniref:Kinesin-like protein KIP1 n=1 Tax=Phytophthora ramorum TaxID=164328 RepID=UPI0030A7C646|nr:Kinesin-like protein KIP1 [Phytophthora ramorum]
MAESIEAAERVRVLVRVRPPNDRERQQNSVHHTLTVDDEGGQVFVCKKKSEHEVDRELRYAYDRVFGEKADQADVFNYLRDGVQQVAQGFNCTIFAYGQTGTGKTHTMLGHDLERHLEMTSLSPEAPECSPHWGVIPRAIESLFEELQSISRHGSAGVVHCSYMQIYNNDVYDLLQDNKQRMKDPLAVREMIKGNGKQIYRFERASKAQELVLQEIQTERRELERQLELLSASDNQDRDLRDDKNGRQTRSEADPCPICGNDIDEHSDVELDRCIELEMNMVKQTPPDRGLPQNKVVQQRPNTQSEKVQASGSHTRATPRSAASDPRLRRVSTSAHGKASPFLAKAAQKPSTPPQMRITGKPSIGEGRANAARESRPKEAFSSSNNGHQDTPRGTSSTDANNQADTHSSLTPPQVSVPILRQGHKDLKALKKFRAASPYNNVVPRKEKRAVSPKIKQESSSTTDASSGEDNRPLNTVVNSVRDIGLELSVYKFRYDCWYACTIVGFDRKRRMHCCQYDCGDKQWQDLSGHKVKVIGRSEDSS